MDAKEKLDQIIFLLGQIQISGLENINRFAAVNILVCELRELIEKHEENQMKDGD